MAARRRELVSVDVEREIALGVLEEDRASRGDEWVRLQQASDAEAPRDEDDVVLVGAVNRLCIRQKRVNLRRARAE